MPFGYFGNDPWRVGRPMSFGHLRSQVDSFITAPWHSYITAYSDADVSAQQMDGAIDLANAPHFHYVDNDKPTYNTEDRYEGRDDKDTALPADYKEVKNPDYFYRRLFWANLLSGSGATYGADPAWKGLATYSSGRYDTRIATGIPLVGLNSIQQIPHILHEARADLAQFQPNDRLIPTPTPASNWTEFDRAQAASNTRELLTYIANTVPPIIEPSQIVRRAVTAATTGKTINVDLTAFTKTVYSVTWYSPVTGLQMSPSGGVVTVTGNIAGLQSYVRALTAPAGDSVLYISPPWCPSPNACEPMDDAPPLVYTNTLGFKAGADQNTQLVTDTRRIALDYPDSAAWRCDRLPATETAIPGCWVRYDFDMGRTVASADFHFRRNSASAYQGVYFMVVRNEGDQQIVDGASLNVWLSPQGILHVNSDIGGDVITPVPGIATETNRWYHLFVRAEKAPGGVTLNVSVDDVPILSQVYVAFRQGNVFFRRVIVHGMWWSAATDVGVGSTPGIWWDELSIDPPETEDLQGLYQTVFQQGLGYYAGNKSTWFDSSGGYNSTNLLHVGANNGIKSLLRFDVSNIPATAVVDEATLQLYYTGRSNGNTLTLGAHRVLADWIDSEANRVQRKAGVNWQVAGMGSGSDYATTAEATAALTGAGGAWVDLDLTTLVQAWVTTPADNKGLVLLQEAASGYVTYDFCSELGWSPCAAAQTPRLTLRYHLVPPTPVKATFQQGSGGYTGNQATYFDAASGYNNSHLLQVGANNSAKALLKFDVAAIPAGKTVDEAMLRLYYLGRSNGNSLTLGAHQVLLDWTDSQANRVQRQSGVNWNVTGMGSGSDYLAAADSAVDVLGTGGSWIELDVTEMAQVWVNNAADNKGVVALQEAASGSVVYSFCSELGWSPCTAAQAPKLTVWYRP